MSDITIDQQFIEYVVKSLVENPDAVSVERTIDEKGVLLLLTVDPEDLGRVIGKRGATAQSMRTLLRALGTKNESRYNLKIVDNGYPKPGRDGDSDERRDDDSEESSRYENDASDDQEAMNDDREGMKKPARPSDMEDEDQSSSSSEYESDFSSDTKTTDDSSDDESAVQRTRRELEDLDDLDI